MIIIISHRTQLFLYICVIYLALFDASPKNWANQNCDCFLFICCPIWFLKSEDRPQKNLLRQFPTSEINFLAQTFERCCSNRKVKSKWGLTMCVNNYFIFAGASHSTHEYVIATGTWSECGKYYSHTEYVVNFDLFLILCIRLRTLYCLILHSTASVEVNEVRKQYCGFKRWFETLDLSIKFNNLCWSGCRRQQLSEGSGFRFSFAYLICLPTWTQLKRRTKKINMRMSKH